MISLPSPGWPQCSGILCKADIYGSLSGLWSPLTWFLSKPIWSMRGRCVPAFWDRISLRSWRNLVAMIQPPSVNHPVNSSWCPASSPRHHEEVGAAIPRYPKLLLLLLLGKPPFPFILTAAILALPPRLWLLSISLMESPQRAQIRKQVRKGNSPWVTLILAPSQRPD